MNYNSPSEIKALLSSMGITLKKRWGQNFLISEAVRNRIIELVGPEKGSPVWEIGPGLGAMTASLLASGAKVTLFEIDWGMIRFLTGEFKEFPNLKIIQGDVVKTWESTLKEYGRPERVMGNLPYASASVIIASFIKKGFIPGSIVFTIQRELAQRMTALPGTKNYSSFSVLFQYAFTITIKQDIQKGSFYPAPDVVSSIIKGEPAQREISPGNPRLFFHIIRTGFKSRRKTLLNNLMADKSGTFYSSGQIEPAIEKSGFTRRTRAEELRVEDFIRLANMLGES